MHRSPSIGIWGVHVLLSLLMCTIREGNIIFCFVEDTESCEIYDTSINYYCLCKDWYECRYILVYYGIDT